MMKQNISDAPRVAILIFDGVELLDFAGPFEVFSAARRDATGQERFMEVFTVAEEERPITCNNGLVVHPRYSLEACPAFDILVVPGGQGTRAAIHRAPLIDWIRQGAAQATLTTSVCTGSFLLAQAGLLTGRVATTHWGSIERMRQDFPQVTVREAVRWVDEGEVISSAGISAGIDMSLYVLARLYGDECAAVTARRMEYDHWPVAAA